jgi:hypothetical protein
MWILTDGVEDPHRGGKKSDSSPEREEYFSLATSTWANCLNAAHLLLRVLKFDGSPQFRPGRFSGSADLPLERRLCWPIAADTFLKANNYAGGT